MATKWLPLEVFQERAPSQVARKALIYTDFAPLWECTGLVARTVFKIAEAAVMRLVGSIPTRSRQLKSPCIYAGFCSTAWLSLHRLLRFSSKNARLKTTAFSHSLQPLAYEER
jgi:hypothetical protein